MGLGGNPDHPDGQSVHPLGTLVAETGTVLRANATPTVIVRDHRGEPPGTRIAPPAPVSGGATPSGDGCMFASGMVLRDHRTGASNSATIADPTQRLPALLSELNTRLQQNYSFTVYAANA